MVRVDVENNKLYLNVERRSHMHYKINETKHTAFPVS
jgi:hypothetical protein